MLLRVGGAVHGKLDYRAFGGWKGGVLRHERISAAGGGHFGDFHARGEGLDNLYIDYDFPFAVDYPNGGLGACPVEVIFELYIARLYLAVIYDFLVAVVVQQREFEPRGVEHLGKAGAALFYDNAVALGLALVEPFYFVDEFGVVVFINLLLRHAVGLDNYLLYCLALDIKQNWGGFALVGYGKLIRLGAGRAGGDGIPAYHLGADIMEEHAHALVMNPEANTGVVGLPAFYDLEGPRGGHLARFGVDFHRFYSLYGDGLNKNFDFGRKAHVSNRYLLDAFLLGVVTAYHIGSEVYGLGEAVGVRNDNPGVA